MNLATRGFCCIGLKQSFDSVFFMLLILVGDLFFPREGNLALSSLSCLVMYSLWQMDWSGWVGVREGGIVDCCGYSSAG